VTTYKSKIRLSSPLLQVAYPPLTYMRLRWIDMICENESENKNGVKLKYWDELFN